MTDERRRDYPDIVKKLEELGKSVIALDKTQAVMLEFQARIGPQIDKVHEMLTHLPCDARKVYLDASGCHIRFLWVVVSGIVLTLLIAVGANVNVMNEIRKEHISIKEDISYIRIHSYGVQDALNGRQRSTVH